MVAIKTDNKGGIKILNKRKIPYSSYELKPHLCPVCRGSGSVPTHFYIENKGTSLAGEVTCKACQGVGYIVC